LILDLKKMRFYEFGGVGEVIELFGILIPFDTLIV
jgi:hypothetical protein